jgi:hypothetical protein
MEFIGWLLTVLTIVMLTIIGLRADAIGKQLTSIDNKLSELIDLMKKQ